MLRKDLKHEKKNGRKMYSVGDETAPNHRCLINRQYVLFESFKEAEISIERKMSAFRVG